MTTVSNQNNDIIVGVDDKNNSVDQTTSQSKATTSSTTSNHLNGNDINDNGFQPLCFQKEVCFVLYC
jgi:hypothetical protein